MPPAFSFLAFDPESGHPRSIDSHKLAKRLCAIGAFIRKVRAQMRCGDLTRAPIHLIRFEMKENEVQCDWIARSADPWDSSLHPDIGRRNASRQALRDAIEVRRLLFEILPNIDQAFLRIYQELPGQQRELIIFGQMHREALAFRHIRSIVMRAKLLGFCFSLENNILSSIAGEEHLEISA